MEEVRHAYSVQASRYIDLFGTTEEVHPDDLAFITRHLSMRPGTVLDVGCGPGHLTEHLRSRGVEATGIDIVPEFVEHARNACPLARFVLGSLERLPVPSRSVSGILAWYSLIHLPTQQMDETLAEFRRVLAPGGTLVVGFFDGVEAAAFEHKVVTAWFWPVEELSERLRRAGLIEVERLHRPAADGVRPHGAIAAIVG